jgi:hypothetical protein
MIHERGSAFTYQELKKEREGKVLIEKLKDNFNINFSYRLVNW